jgi:hypothetical protein
MLEHYSASLYTLILRLQTVRQGDVANSTSCILSAFTHHGHSLSIPIVCLDEHEMLSSAIILSYFLVAYAQTVSAPAPLRAHGLIRRQNTNTRFIGLLCSSTHFFESRVWHFCLLHVSLVSPWALAPKWA